MATTATCTRFTDEYQLYEELGKTWPPRPPSRTGSQLHVAVPCNCFCAGTRHCYSHSAMLQSPLPCPCERTR
ncbi:hypothetical protein Nmel_010531, partial [Mimus melanotis]